MTMPAATPHRKSSRRFLRFTIRGFLAAAVVICVLLVLAGYAINWMNPFAGRKFDRDVWRSYGDVIDADSPRASMVEDLKHNHLRIGTHKRDVLFLLGDPEIKDRGVWMYNLGAWSGLRWDDDYLHIQFDRAEKISRIEVVQH